MSYSHSSKPNLPVTHSSPLSAWLSVLFCFFPPPLNHAVRAGLWVLLVALVTLPSQLPYPHRRLCIVVNIKWFMDCLYLIVYGCLRLRFLDVETNPGPRRPAPVSADYCVVLCGAWPGTLVT